MRNLEREVLKKITGNGILMPLQAKSSLSEVFHENTKLTPLSGREYSRHIARMTASPQAKRLMAVPYKVYSLFDQVEMEQPEPRTALEESILARKSQRAYTGEPVSLEELSRLLFFTYGRTGPKRNLRPVASGGALYPLEFYVAARNVSGLEPGLYHYSVEHHKLDVLKRGDCWDAVQRYVWLQDIEAEKAAMVVVITAAFMRSTTKYKDRGYRMVLMEAGEAAQNFALLCASHGLGACLLGGFLDDPLAELLGLDGVDEAPLLPIVVGRLPGGEEASAADGGGGGE